LQADSRQHFTNDFSKTMAARHANALNARSGFAQMSAERVKNCSAPQDHSILHVRRCTQLPRQSTSKFSLSLAPVKPVGSPNAETAADLAPKSNAYWVDKPRIRSPNARSQQRSGDVVQPSRNMFPQTLFDWRSASKLRSNRTQPHTPERSTLIATTTRYAEHSASHEAFLADPTTPMVYNESSDQPFMHIPVCESATLKTLEANQFADVFG